MAEIDEAYEAQLTLKRIRPKILAKIREAEPEEDAREELIETIDVRLAAHWPRLFSLLYRLYGQHYDFYYYLENILLTAMDCWLSRPADLKQLDLRREHDPGWYQSERMVGSSLYVDLFSGDLKTLKKCIPYLQELGLTYLHLMPLFKSRPDNSDGGYAISDYRSVDPHLGTMEDLRAVAKKLRKAGISLVLDFVFNHTSDEHPWAIRAQEFDREYQDYYHIFADRSLPDQYEQKLREVFPTIRRGNFSWHEGMQRWVWTTFNSFQWDLKYSNPEVFRAMASEMLFLANTGVEILRLDAVAFIWKQLGTSCENLPEAHVIIQAFNAICRIAAPGLVFKSEAIVHPDEVARYIHREECQLSYNPTLMALLWESLATRDTRLLRTSLSHRQALPQGTAWIDYLRGHDDIGWSFADQDAWHAGINPAHHRSFLNAFYTGNFEGSFARGIPFQLNPDTGDMRISGTMASLIGLEEAMEKGDAVLLEQALNRTYLAYRVLFSIGGIPLLFMGEEWGALNDYSFVTNPNRADDSRWVHRPKMDWSLLDRLHEPDSVPADIFHVMRRLINMRKQCAALGGNQIQLLPVTNTHILAYRRWHDEDHLTILANFSEQPQFVDLRGLGEYGVTPYVRDLFTNKSFPTNERCVLKSYECMWLAED